MLSKMHEGINRFIDWIQILNNEVIYSLSIFIISSAIPRRITLIWFNWSYLTDQLTTLCIDMSVFLLTSGGFCRVGLSSTSRCCVRTAWRSCTLTWDRDSTTYWATWSTRDSTTGMSWNVRAEDLYLIFNIGMLGGDIVSNTLFLQAKMTPLP